MNTDDIRTLYAFNRWANQRMFSVVEKLNSEQLSTPVTSSFPSVEESVLHILAAEWIWLKRWTGMSPRARVSGVSTAETMRSALRDGGVAVEELTSLAGIRSFGDSIEQQRQEFLRNLSDDKLHATLHYTDMSSTAFSAPLVQLMQHVVNHGTYHRGQVTTLLRQLGAATIGLDVMIFFREARPQNKEARAAS